jgi:ferredoxin
VKAVQFADTGRTVEVKTQANVLQALLAERVPVKMACGGRGICATCHVFVQAGASCLTPRTKREERTLSLIGESSGESRLACQAKVLGDGVIIRLPEGLYVAKSGDVEELIGRRADTRILHPVDGRVLVQAGKIITRTTAQALISAAGDVQALMHETRDA